MKVTDKFALVAISSYVVLGILEASYSDAAVVWTVAGQQMWEHDVVVLKQVQVADRTAALIFGAGLLLTFILLF